MAKSFNGNVANSEKLSFINWWSVYGGLDIDHNVTTLLLQALVFDEFFNFSFFISCLQVAQPFFDWPFGDLLPPKKHWHKKAWYWFLFRIFCFWPKWWSSLGRFSQIDGYKPYMKYKTSIILQFFWLHIENQM